MLQVPLKLLVNKETNKVLFAEAGKDFVDILFSFLTLPLGTIARLLPKESNMESGIGSLNSIYQSVENLNVDYFKTLACKEMLLNPRNASGGYCSTIKFNIDDSEPTKYFMCSKLGDLQSDKVCDGFVKDSPTFIVTDDLTVLPNSMDTSFGLLKRFGIKSTSSVKEMNINITERSQMLDLLKYCLLSKSPLTDLFLEKEPFIEETSFSTCDNPYNSGNGIKLKIFLTKADGEILFAQGEEDFADFLFSFLTFPLGGVVRMLEGNSSLGSIDSLYKSIIDLDGYKYLMSNE
ncbi:DUF674 family protein, partial [Trifolium medium]|nr:DUF674 family protein [Trifolium medium]